MSSLMQKTKEYMLKISFNNSQGHKQEQWMGVSKAGKFAYEMERLGIKVSWTLEGGFIEQPSENEKK